MKKGFIVMGMTVVMMTFFMGGIALLSSCTGDMVDTVTDSIPKPDIRYEISYQYEVPDSMQADFRAYVLELTEVASQPTHTSTTSKSKYKGDVVQECHHIARDMFVRKLIVLKIKYYVDDVSKSTFYVPKNELTPEELEIYKELGGR